MLLEQTAECAHMRRPQRCANGRPRLRGGVSLHHCFSSADTVAASPKHKWLAESCLRVLALVLPFPVRLFSLRSHCTRFVFVARACFALSTSPTVSHRASSIFFQQSLLRFVQHIASADASACCSWTRLFPCRYLRTRAPAAHDRAHRRHRCCPPRHGPLGLDSCACSGAACVRAMESRHQCQHNSTE